MLGFWILGVGFLQEFDGKTLRNGEDESWNIRI